MNKKTIDGIRGYYKLPADITDEQIKRELKGSIGETVVNIDIAKQDLKKAFSKAIPNTIKRHFKL